MHDDVICFLEMKKLGFSTGLELITGKQVVKALTDALFYFQPHIKTLQARIPNFIPAYFVCLQQKIYNDPKAHKHAVLPMKREAEEKVSSPLVSSLILPVMQTPTWKEFAAAIRALAENAHKCYTCLEEKADTMQQVHHSASVIRSIHDGNSSTAKFITKADVRKPNLIARYNILEEKLARMEEDEEPVFFGMILHQIMPGLGICTGMKSHCLSKLKCTYTTMGTILVPYGTLSDFHRMLTCMT